MLLGGCSETFGGGSLRFHLAYAGQMHIYSLSRSFLLYDSAFVPAQQEEPVDKHVYYALLRGRLLVREHEQSFDGP